MNPDESNKSRKVRPTMKHVAVAAGVSRATVSNALSGTGRLSEATRLRVLEVAARLGYSMNSSAERLRMATSRTVTLLLETPKMRRVDGGVMTYWDRFVLRLSQELTRYDVQLVIHAATEPPRRLHGDLVMLSEDRLASDQCPELPFGAPVLASGDGSLSSRASAYYTFDHSSMTRTAMSWLKEVGSTRPALITRTGLTFEEQRLSTYLQWCREMNTQPHFKEVEPGAASHDVLDVWIKRKINEGIDGFYIPEPMPRVTSEPTIASLGIAWIADSAQDPGATDLDDKHAVVDLMPAEAAHQVAGIIDGLLSGAEYALVQRNPFRILTS